MKLIILLIVIGLVLCDFRSPDGPSNSYGPPGTESDGTDDSDFKFSPTHFDFATSTFGLNDFFHGSFPHSSNFANNLYPSYNYGYNGLKPLSSFTSFSLPHLPSLPNVVPPSSIIPPILGGGLVPPLPSTPPVLPPVVPPVAPPSLPSILPPAVHKPEVFDHHHFSEVSPTFHYSTLGKYPFDQSYFSFSYPHSSFSSFSPFPSSFFNKKKGHKNTKPLASSYGPPAEDGSDTTTDQPVSYPYEAAEDPASESPQSTNRPAQEYGPPSRV